MRKFVVIFLVMFIGIIGLSFVDVKTEGQIVSIEKENLKDRFRKSDNPIANRYIVVLNEKEFESGAANEQVAENLTARYGGRIDKVFTDTINGYSTEMSTVDAEKLSSDPEVKYVEEDGAIYASSSQPNAVWGIDRLDQRSLPLNTNYTYAQTGNGIHAYVIDSGIRVTHAEFGGRAVASYDNVNDGQNGIDCYGHGTHVAGTIGGETYGVAKNATLHAVRVLGCNGAGSISGLLDAIEWVTQNRINPAVANVSLSAMGVSSSLDTAIANATASGVTFVVAAGNNYQDACSFSPARAPSAITVGATTGSDQRAVFSNSGVCVDIFAPGSGITSAWVTSDTATSTLNGTSMASPHVTGAVALFFESNPTASPAMAAAAISSFSTTGVISNLDAVSPNKLLYTLMTATSNPTPTPTPTPTPNPTPTSSPTPNASPTPLMTPEPTPEPTPSMSPTPNPTPTTSPTPKPRRRNRVNMFW